MGDSEDKLATKEALERIRKTGSDLRRPLTMDFFVAVPDEPSGHAVAERVKQLGFATAVEQSEDGEWTCTCSKEIVATFDEVWSTEKLLDRLSADVQGCCDGFGSFGNAQSG